MRTRRTRMIMLALLAACALIIIMVATSSASSGFTHEAHLERAGKCAVCHAADALDVSPDAAVCAACHKGGGAAMGYEPGQTETHGVYWYKEHKSYARIGGMPDHRAMCSSCHAESYCNDCHRGSFREQADSEGRMHRSDYLVTHPIMARRNPNACMSCHEQKTCNACHSRFNRADLKFSSHRRGWSDLPAGLGTKHEDFKTTQCDLCHSGGVLPSHVWTDQHGREARRNIQLCQTCHEDADVCIKCHSARSGLRVNPHPKGWSKIQNNFRRASDGRTCIKCH